ncbi:MAG: bifunctional demethylmenaquinone methyltransferase/2-methoxy-6-polyprenyl-1,4-benzoquinol methylase UbiE [Bacteroidia bacterium]|nr:bifunctional demethylmenaquinone methyltransferase/2-methoxy-6-polyprenyl-1,4-benzoquinol methylase UbiE [Bacteroidia bacterium]
MVNSDQILNQDNKSGIGSMFDDIALRYDFLNHLLSFGIDHFWRRKAIKVVSETYKNPRILDVATGTGDLAIAALKLDPVHITGIDISQKMLESGNKKIRKRGLSGKIDLIPGDSENLPFSDNSFDVAMVAFGVRNFSDRLKGLSEMNRVLNEKGMAMVLEFSKPDRFPFRQIYYFYFKTMLPVIGRLFSRNRVAYSYLPDSVMQFPDNERFMALMQSAGFYNVSHKKLTGGIACIYTGFKSPKQ